MNLPPWLLENPNLQTDPSQGTRPFFKKRSFLAKTLSETTRALQEGFFAEQIALMQGFLQSLDPRIKLFSLLTFLLTLNLIHSVSLTLGFLLFTLFLASLSKISPRFLLRRVGFLVLFFGALPLFPSLFNWIRPGDSLLTLYTFSSPVHWGPFSFPRTLSLTTQGVQSFLLFIGRLWASLTYVTVITLTTRWNNLLGAMRAFYIPKIFIMTLEMTYRYIHVFIQAVQELLLARKARDAGHSKTKEQRSFVASSLGSLFGKSVLLGEEVYFSMLARGYNGEPRIQSPHRLNWKDLLVLSFSLLLALILFAADQVLGGIV